MVLSKPSSNAPVLTRWWKQLIRCYLLLLLLEILPLHSPFLVTPQMCCLWARMQDQLQLGNVFCYLAQLQRGHCWQGRAEQAAGELWPVLLSRNKGELHPSLCPVPQTSCVFGSTSRLLPYLKAIVGDQFPLLYVSKGRWFLNDTQMEKCLGTGHQSSQMFGSLACRETKGNQEPK